MRWLVITSDRLGPSMAGPAMRALEMARALASHGEVVLASHQVDEGFASRPVDVTRWGPDDRDLRSLAASARAIIVQGPVLERLPWLIDGHAPLVVDLYDPMIFEALHDQGKAPAGRRLYSYERILALTLTQLLHGDYFIVANRRQRDLYTGMLAMVGRLNPVWFADGASIERIVGIVPCGVPSEPPPAPAPSGADEGPLIVWCGGLWDWTDPITLVRAMRGVVREWPGARLELWGTRHPNPEVPATPVPGAASRVAAELGLGDVVRQVEWVPYHERGPRLARADVAVSLALDGLESRFAHRTRLLDCIWAGVPIVSSRGDTLSTLVHRRRLGRVVAPSDVAGLERALLSLLADPAERASIRERMAGLREKLSWERAVRPLVRYLKNARRDPLRGSLDLLGPLASVVTYRWPVVRPLVKSGVTLARQGVWALFEKACRAGVRSLHRRSGARASAGERS